METDDELVRETLRGEERAFETLRTRHARVLYNLALEITTDREAAELIVRQSFAKVYRNLPELRGRFDTWLVRIVSCGSRDWLRKKRHEERLRARQAG